MEREAGTRKQAVLVEEKAIPECKDSANSAF